MLNLPTTNSNKAKALSKELKRELLADYSATVTYCRHTGIKLVIGTEFQQTALRGKFLKHEHPIFSLVPNKLLTLISKSFNSCNTTEQYLLMVAFIKLIKSASTNSSDTPNSILDTSNCPLLLEEAEVTQLGKSFYYLVKSYKQLVGNHRPLPLLPTFKVTAELSTDISALVAFIKRVTTLLEQASFYYEPASYELTNAEKLDDELALEKQLGSILNNYSSTKKSKGYNSRLGKWAIKQLVIVAPHLDDDKIASIAHYIQSDSLNLDDEILKEYINLLEDVLPMEELEREQSLLVIAHLKSKLDVIYKCLEDYSFVLLEDEELTIGSRKATKNSSGLEVGGIAGVRVTSKKVVGNIGKAPAKVIPTAQRQTYGAGDATSRLLAKFGKTKAPSVVTAGHTQSHSKGIKEQSNEQLN